VTASERRADRDARSLAGRALDLLLYAPAGALLSTIEDMPSMAAKGRARVDQEVRNARVVGRFAVDFGLRQAKGHLERLTGEGGHRAPLGRDGAHRDAPVAPRRVAGRERGPAAPPRRVARPDAGSTADAAAPRPPVPQAAQSRGRNPAADLAIPDYDTLSASQVVRRLDGLGRAELRAVVRHERATRARRTILHRAEQLLGTASSDRPAATSGSPDAGDEPPGA
jgi:hypothetical protein